MLAVLLAATAVVAAAAAAHASADCVDVSVSLSPDHVHGGGRYELEIDFVNCSDHDETFLVSDRSWSPCGPTRATQYRIRLVAGAGMGLVGIARAPRCEGRLGNRVIARSRNGAELDRDHDSLIVSR